MSKGFHRGERGIRLMQYLVDDMRKTPIHVLIAGMPCPPMPV
jgi:hypothetical protein